MKLVKDIRELTKERLVQILGPKTGEKLYEYSRGIDRQELGEQDIRKSISAEVNWGVRFENQQQANDFIASLCGAVETIVESESKRQAFLNEGYATLTRCSSRPSQASWPRQMRHT